MHRRVKFNVEKSGGACLASLECGGHKREEQPLTLLVEWFLAGKSVVGKVVGDEVSRRCWLLREGFRVRLM